MLSKILVPHCRGWGLAMSLGSPLGGPMGCGLGACSPRVTAVPRRVRLEPGMLTTVRYAGHLIPPSQYDIPFPQKLVIGTLLRVNWEIIPLFFVTAVALTILFFSIIWACRNKVDAVFSTHSCNNISRTMNLRKPTVHKIIIINQRYEPWPEMQDVLDKMLVAEHRAMMKATKCSYEQREGHPPLEE